MVQVTAFYRIDCPICAELKPRLQALCVERNLTLLEVYIEADPTRPGAETISHPLMDRYWYVMRTAFGGEMHVPLVLLGRDLWFVPSATTAARPGRRHSREEIVTAVRELMGRLERAVGGYREEDLPDCHYMYRFVHARA